MGWLAVKYLLTAAVVVDRAPAALPAEVKLVSTLSDGRAVLDLPRYYNFRLAATRLAEDGSRLVDIAGNDSVILVTAWRRSGDAAEAAPYRVLFEQPLLTMPGTARTAYVVPVAELSSFLLRPPAQGLKVEHVYDY